MQERDATGKRIKRHPTEWNDGSSGWNCDFCHYADAPEMWFYIYEPFEFYVEALGTTIAYQEAAMAACEQCHLIIESDNIALLVNVSIEALKRKTPAQHPHPQFEAVFHNVLSRAYNLFRANRTGPPVHKLKMSSKD